MDKETATKLYSTSWWEGCTDEEIALIQLVVDRIICPFTVFHTAVGNSIDKEVSIISFWYGRRSLIQELINKKFESK